VLTTSQKEFFEREGYVNVEQGLREADIQLVADEYDAWVEGHADRLLSEGRITNTCSEMDFETRLVGLCHQDEQTYREADHIVDICNVLGEQTFQFLRHARLLDLIESIVGPEITCSPIQHIRCKLPADLWDGADSYVAPWHQDAQVHTEDADPHYILTVWIPLVDTDEANGCLKLIPGVHRESKVLWSEGFGISEMNLPAREVLTVPAKKGDVIFLHKLTPHCSEPNRTNRIRWSMDLRYQRTGTHSGRACYPSFVARSRSQPSAELVDWRVWKKSWQTALKAYPTKLPRSTRPEEPIEQSIEL
jgi:phytanoyl-CoA hydroxylase